MHWLSFLAAQQLLLNRPEPRRPEPVPEPELRPFTERRAEAWRLWALHNPGLQSPAGPRITGSDASISRPTRSHAES
jgi:hypothetical protein